MKELLPTGGADNTPAPRRRRRGARALAACGVLIFAIAIFLALSAAALQRGDFALPAWAELKIESALAEQLNASQVSLEAATLRLGNGFQLQMRFADVRLRDAAAERLLDLGALEAKLDISELLAGRIAPTEITLSSLALDVTRARDGSLQLSLPMSPTAASSQPSDNPAELDLFEAIDRLDNAFQSASLRQLGRLDAENVRISFTDILEDQRWSVDGGQLRLRQDAQSLALSTEMVLLTGRDSLASVTLDLDLDRTAELATLSAQLDGMEAQDLATTAQALGWLELLDAPLSGALRVALTETGFGQLSATLSVGDGAVTVPGSDEMI
ncbi:MAG: hypothetical protein AAF330_00420, partial [Pseudomonadota bacterium]